MQIYMDRFSKLVAFIISYDIQCIFVILNIRSLVSRLIMKGNTTSKPQLEAVCPQNKSSNGNVSKSKMSRSVMFTKIDSEDHQEGNSKKDQLQEKKHKDHRVLMEGSIKLNGLTCSPDLVGNHNPDGPLKIDKMLTKRVKINKRLTYNFNTTNQQTDNTNPHQGCKTARSNGNNSSLCRLNSNYLEASIRQEEQMLKKIEEKALMLKKKEKKEREILKQFKKTREQLNQNSPTNTYSLSVIAANKPKTMHRRGESFDFPIPQTREISSSYLQSLDVISSDNEEKASIFQSPAQKVNEQPSRLEKIQQTVVLLKQEGMKKQAQKEELNRLFLKQKEEIKQLNLTISIQTKKLQQISTQNRELEDQLKAQKTKNFEKQHQIEQLQISITQHKQSQEKQQQMYLKELLTAKNQIQAMINEHQLKEKFFTIESQNNEAKLKVLKDQIAKKELELSNRGRQHQEVHNKYRTQIQNTLIALKEEIGKLKQENARLHTVNQEKIKQINNMHSFLRNAQDHIKKVEGKYHEISKQLTQKNVSFDFLWIQLKEQENKRKIMEGQVTKMNLIRQESLQNSLVQSSENDSPMKQEDNDRSILSLSTLKDMKDLRGMIQEGQVQKCASSRSRGQQFPISLPLSHQNSLTFNNYSSKILPESLKNVDSYQKANDLNNIPEEKQLQLETLQPAASNIFLKTELSDAMSQSEQNDDINDLVSKNNSNTSKMESSIGAFSEYSRIKSTQSEMTCKEVEDQYRSKMKNNKILAKLGRFKAKK